MDAGQVSLLMLGRKRQEVKRLRALRPGHGDVISTDSAECACRSTWPEPSRYLQSILRMQTKREKVPGADLT